MRGRRECLRLIYWGKLVRGRGVGVMGELCDAGIATATAMFKEELELAASARVDLKEELIGRMDGGDEELRRSMSALGEEWQQEHQRQEELLSQQEQMAAEHRQLSQSREVDRHVRDCVSSLISLVTEEHDTREAKQRSEQHARMVTELREELDTRIGDVQSSLQEGIEHLEGRQSVAESQIEFLEERGEVRASQQAGQREVVSG